MEKCITCGFLCKHVSGSYVPTPKFFEMDADDRRTGRVFQHTIDTLRGPGYAHPACFRMVDSVRAELEPIANKTDRFLEIATRERKCGKWALYEAGFSPMYHLQDLRMNELELNRQKFEVKMQDDNKAFMNELHSSNRNLQIALAVVVAIFAIAQMAFPNGWPWLMRILGSLPIESPLPPMPEF